MATYLDHEKFGSRIAMAEKMNVNFTAEYNQKQVRAYSKLYQDAVKLMNSEDLNAFDITKEPESMHELYGTSNFGQGCLLARRLIENKVRYVEVSRGGWDTHDNNFEAVSNNCADIDKALSALLTDLELRGLLKETLVVLTSEFGRTPKINGREMDEITGLTALLHLWPVEESKEVQHMVKQMTKVAHLLKENSSSRKI